LGGTTTSVVVYEEGDLQHVAIIPMGSVNITNDLAIGLRTDLDIAEAVKIQHAAAISGGKEAPKTISHKHGNETTDFSRKDIDMIVGARLDEIFELVDKELASIDRAGKLPGGVVLTGGGANLKQLAVYAKEKLRLPVRVAKFDGFSGMNDRIAKPEFAASLGLMMADFETAPIAPGKNSPRGGNKSGGDNQSFGKLFKGASDLFKRFKV
jgi:cell division protein FtsA